MKKKSYTKAWVGGGVSIEPTQSIFKSIQPIDMKLGYVW